MWTGGTRSSQWVGGQVGRQAGGQVGRVGSTQAGRQVGRSVGISVTYASIHVCMHACMHVQYIGISFANTFGFVPTLACADQDSMQPCNTLQGLGSPKGPGGCV